MAQGDVLDFLAEQGKWIPTQQIMIKLGLNIGSVLDNCKRLEKQGFILGRKAYFLDGSRFIKRYEWRIGKHE